MYTLDGPLVCGFTRYNVQYGLFETKILVSTELLCIQEKGQAKRLCIT